MKDYHRVVAEVDLDAIAHNIREIRRVTKKETEIMAVVKADAYGHGAIEISEILLENGANRLAVAILEEGKQLREAGIEVPILILGYTSECQVDEIIKHNLTQTVFSYDMAKALSHSAQANNNIAKIHIKIDTGMGRIGFPPNEETLSEIQKIMYLPNIEVEGIFTHFPSADEADQEFTYQQIDQFSDFNKKLEDAKIHIPIKHAANSAGIMEFEEAHMNLVRPGIVLYGLYPSQEVHKQKLQLQPAMSLKTHVTYLKEVEQGYPISYGRTFITQKRSRIATIPVGYADGYSRRLSGMGRVLVEGVYAPIVGRICMDQFMIDVSHVPKACVGSEVVLMGNQYGNSVSAEEIADTIGTINYEVVCMVGKRIPRVYVKNKKVINVIQYL